MPIVVPRTGPVQPASLPQVDADRLWEEIVRTYAQNHPDIFQQTKEEET